VALFTKGRTTEIVRTTVVRQIYDGAGYSRNQEFVPEGDKRVGSATSGAHKAQSPRWDLGQSPQNTKNMLKIWLNVTNFIKKFSVWQFRKGRTCPLVPLPYAPDINMVETDCFSLALWSTDACAVCRTVTQEQYVSSSSQTGQNKAFQRWAKASLILSVKFTKPKNSLVKTDLLPSTAGIFGMAFVPLFMTGQSLNRTVRFGRSHNRITTNCTVSLSSAINSLYSSATVNESRRIAARSIEQRAIYRISHHMLFVHLKRKCRRWPRF